MITLIKEFYQLRKDKKNFKVLTQMFEEAQNTPAFTSQEKQVYYERASYYLQRANNLKRLNRAAAMHFKLLADQQEYIADNSFDFLAINSRLQKYQPLLYGLIINLDVRRWK